MKKRTALLLVIAGILVCVAGTLYQKLQPFRAAEVRAAEPRTLAEWLDAQNKKLEKCPGNGVMRVASSGYQSYTEECVGGVTVYRDTSRETQAYLEKEQRDKDELIRALISRCLTAAEFRAVTQEGYMLFTREMTPYREEDLQSRFNAALQTQQILRMKCPEQEAK